jgi:hypothetical protein
MVNFNIVRGHFASWLISAFALEANNLLSSSSLKEIEMKKRKRMNSITYLLPYDFFHFDGA